MCLDYQSSIPLHVQLENVLRNEILKGNYSTQIPSERELMERFTVSRSTVRRAITALVQDGILEKRHGKGTFISRRPVEEWLGNLKTYNEIIKSMGMKPGIKLLNEGVIQAPVNVSDALGLSEVYMVERLRFADEMPVAIEQQYYPREIGLELAKFDLNNVGIYDILESSLGINLWAAEQVISGGRPTKKETELLSIPYSACVIITERHLNSAEGTPIEYERSVYRSDMYKFRIKLTRKRG